MRIVIITTPSVDTILHKLQYRPPTGISIEKMDSGMMGPNQNATIQDALRLESEQDIDVFIAVGRDAERLAPLLRTPLVMISVDGFDFMTALHSARSESLPNEKIGFLRLKDRHARWDKDYVKMLSMDIIEGIFENLDELTNLLLNLKKQGVQKVIGASSVVERAAEFGMRGYLLYNEITVRHAIDNAVMIALAKRDEANKARLFQTICNHTFSGIVVTDGEGKIIEFNSYAERILNTTRQAVMGKNLQAVFPALQVKELLATAEIELDKVLVSGDVRLLLNCVPMLSGPDVTGIVISFQDIGVIQKSEREIQDALRPRGFIAKAHFSDIIGNSKVMRNLKAESLKLAKSDSTILLRGDTGTGKELFAQAIHNASSRARRVFVALNCASLSSQLLQSELFGYAEGSFTGAKKGGKPGLFEMADKGSIFLDEIGEIDISTQVHLLRVLETREIMRIGDDKVRSVNVRIIAATNQDLREMVKLGTFREDLYYRLCVLELYIPPLRERLEDVPLLVQHFLRCLHSEWPHSIIEAISHDPVFVQHEWNGNIRELRNALERFSALYDENQPYKTQLYNVMRQITNQKGETGVSDILKALQRTGGNKAKAAELLGISRTTLWRKLQQCEIEVG